MKAELTRYADGQDRPIREEKNTEELFVLGRTEMLLLTVGKTGKDPVGNGEFSFGNIRFEMPISCTNQTVDKTDVLN